jgi:diguanylate cyclase (GGDEF)-like protein
MKNKEKEMILNEIKWLDDIYDKIKDIETKTLSVQENINFVENQLINLLKYMNNNNIENKEKIIKKSCEKIKKIIEFSWKNLFNQLNYINNIKSQISESKNYIEQFYYDKNKDSLTWLYNKDFMYNILKIIFKNKEKIDNYIWAFIDVNWLKQINENYWYQWWDKIIKKLWQLINVYFWQNKQISWRIYWDEFMIISNESFEDFKRKMLNFERFLENYKVKLINIKTNNEKKENISISYWIDILNNFEDYNLFIKEIDKKMFENKRKYYKEKK